jgi:hypothetical protein
LRARAKPASLIEASDHVAHLVRVERPGDQLVVGRPELSVVITDHRVQRGVQRRDGGGAQVIDAGKLLEDALPRVELGGLGPRAQRACPPVHASGFWGRGWSPRELDGDELRWRVTRIRKLRR